MTVSQLHEKLGKIIKEGRGDLLVTILTQDKNPPMDNSLIGIKDVSWGDMGGWGAEISIIEPEMEVVLNKKGS